MRAEVGDGGAARVDAAAGAGEARSPPGTSHGTSRSPHGSPSSSPSRWLPRSPARSPPRLPSSSPRSSRGSSRGSSPPKPPSRSPPSSPPRSPPGTSRSGTSRSGTSTRRPRRRRLRRGPRSARRVWVATAMPFPPVSCGPQSSGPPWPSRPSATTRESAATCACSTRTSSAPGGSYMCACFTACSNSSFLARLMR